MNKIVKTETSRPEDGKHFSFWLKHYFEDGSWICIFKYTLYDDEDRQTAVLDFGKDGMVDGRIADDNPDTWAEFHGTVNDIVEGRVAIVTYDFGEDEFGWRDEGVNVEAY